MEKYVTRCSAIKAVMSCSVRLTFLQTGVVFVKGGIGKGFPSLSKLLY